MSTPTTEKDTGLSVDIISPDMAGTIYLGIFKPAAGGKVPVTDKASQEVIFEGQPTVLEGVRPGMPVYREETFGPVASILTFRTEEEAIGLANDTEYGLVASIFTADQARAMRVAAQLKTGIVHINDQTINHEVFGPIGGMGASGNGARSGGPSIMDEYSQWQWITVNEKVPAYPF